MGQAVSISDFATCTVSVQQLSSAAVASKHPTARCTRPWLCPKNSPSYTKQAAGQAWAVGRRSPVLLEELGQFHVSELQGCYTLSGVSGKSLDVATVKFCFKPSKKKKMVITTELYSFTTCTLWIPFFLSHGQPRQGLPVHFTKTCPKWPK